MVSFLTPFWSGAAMMRVHLRSLRRFHPDAPILVSKRGGDEVLMRELQREFAIEYWLEECNYTDAYLRLLERCPTPFACIVDHDTILLSPVDTLIERVRSGSCDLVGVEERIRLPQRVAPAWSDANGWLRFSPGDVASNFLLFEWRAFKSRFGLRGVFGNPSSGATHFDFDYGIGQRLRRHYYLRPFHVPRYGIGNLLKDDGHAIAWHQWYGSHQMRLTDQPDIRVVIEEGEAALLRDYPALDLSSLVPAWGSDAQVAEQRDRESRDRPLAANRWRRLAGAHLRAWHARVKVGLERTVQSRSRSSVTQ